MHHLLIVPALLTASTWSYTMAYSASEGMFGKRMPMEAWLLMPRGGERLITQPYQPIGIGCIYVIYRRDRDMYYVGKTWGDNPGHRIKDHRHDRSSGAYQLLKNKRYVGIAYSVIVATKDGLRLAEQRTMDNFMRAGLTLTNERNAIEGGLVGRVPYWMYQSPGRLAIAW